MSPRIVVHPRVASALRSGEPVVALETAVVTHGLPRCRIELASTARNVVPELRDWDPDEPANHQIARVMDAAVRARGAQPAMTAIIDGNLHIGLDDDALLQLASDETAAKASSTAMASTMAAGGSAGTTVSATLRACEATADVTGQPIRFFATGGIGGVHRDWAKLPDVSTDLVELGRRAVCVVCAGCKSLLDVRATREALETLAVPVLGFRTASMPCFYARPREPIELTASVHEAAEVAATCRVHWDELGSGAGVLVCQPAPEPLLLDADVIERATASAERLADEQGASGAGRTPFVLAEVARQTQGRAIDCNIALLAANACLAAQTAVVWNQTTG